MKKKVEFKGTREGIILQLDAECDFEELLAGLNEKIVQGKKFFSGATVIGVEGRTLNRREKEAVANVFNATEIQVARLDFMERLGHNSSSEKVKAVMESIETTETAEISDKKPEPKTDKSAEKTVGRLLVTATGDRASQRDGDHAKIVFGTMRSGRSIVYAGHVIVVGDVNPGAEILAEGHIVVMGTLRGVAHAGSAGDNTATITAFRLNPTQLRISTLITRPPEGGQAPELPEIARIRDGNIMIEPYL